MDQPANRKSVHGVVAWNAVMHGLNPEKSAAGRAAANLFLGRFPNRLDLQAQAQGNARERVIGVQNDMLWIDFGDGVQKVFGRVRVAVCGQ